MTQSRIFTRSDPPEDYVKASAKLYSSTRGRAAGHPWSTRSCATFTSCCHGTPRGTVAVENWMMKWSCSARFTGLASGITLWSLEHQGSGRGQRNRQAGEDAIEGREAFAQWYYKERLMELSQGFFVTDTPVAEVFELLLLAKNRVAWWWRSERRQVDERRIA